ncbi:hypothetical protein NDA01_22100 [Trichocoleus desertorum AS-A10]|uniref:AbiU2 domain-containing protein n=1 Tax=Trichocoleus desertorum TaxID=1481672 RepID=UPI003299AC52
MEQKIQKWNRWVQILREQITRLVQSNYIYAETRKIVVENSAINNSNLFYDWLTRNYVDATFMGIRRQLDDHSDCISLIKLLRDLQINSTLLTREKHLALYSKDMHTLGHNAFDILAGKDLNVFPEKTLEIDLRQLEKIKALHKEFIDRRIAHYEKVSEVQSLSTFQDLDDAISILENIFQKYFLLLTASSTKLLPIPQYDWTSIFKQSWLPNITKEMEQDE